MTHENFILISVMLLLLVELRAGLTIFYSPLTINAHQITAMHSQKPLDLDLEKDIPPGRVLYFTFTLLK